MKSRPRLKRRSLKKPQQQHHKPKTDKPSDGKIRLQKFLSECGVASRRHAEELILEGKVEVNNKLVTELGTKVDPVRDQVRVKRRIVKPPPRGILLLNKPRGVVSTLSDPEGRPTVADFLTKHYRSYFPVGRLDWDSSGLMILTNDGEMADRLMHPRFGFERTYQVRVEGAVSSRAIEKIEAGVRLQDGMARGRARILRGDESSTWVEITVAEGRNRIVRRLMDKLRHPVMKLKRVQYGPFKLGNLQTGEIRKLTEKEYRSYRERIMRYQPREAPRGNRSENRPGRA